MEYGKQQLPNSPWLWDYPWHAQGIIDSKIKESLNSLVALIVFGAFLAPFNWIAFVSTSSGVFWQFFTAIFDVIVLIGIGSYLLKNIRQVLILGNGRISFQNFPFHLGQKMHLTIERLPEDLTTVHVDLRCIEEAYEIREREGGQKRDSIVVCYQIYHDAQAIRGELVNETGALRCTWNLPNHTSRAHPANAPLNFGNWKSKANDLAWITTVISYCRYTLKLDRELCPHHHIDS